jgi:murein DD-endopeptidase MepM/ murein hydrolase activator NlpD
MKLNPFQESNLSILQYEVGDFFSYYTSPVRLFLKNKWDSVQKYGKERITIMVVPHTEQKIINFHLPVYAIIFIILAIIAGLTLTSVAIINHAYTAKGISKLTRDRVDSKVQIEEYKKEINKLYDNFQELKPELSSVYSLIFQETASTLWAKGGEPNKFDITGMGSNSPSIEELNMQELEQELKISSKVLDDIKQFLSGKKIIENTPSISPVAGYIISKNGKIVSDGYFESGYSKGVEISAYPGTKVIATAPGKVESITWDRAFGLSITIQHKYGYSTVFSHCQNVIVSVNQKVSRGETIAYTGRTGNASKYMCFYQIKIGNEFIDPYPYMR